MMEGPDKVVIPVRTREQRKANQGTTIQLEATRPIRFQKILEFPV